MTGPQLRLRVPGAGRQEEGEPPTPAAAASQSPLAAAERAWEPPPKLRGRPIPLPAAPRPEPPSPRTHQQQRQGTKRRRGDADAGAASPSLAAPVSEVGPPAALAAAAAHTPPLQLDPATAQQLEEGEREAAAAAQRAAALKTEVAAGEAGRDAVRQFVAAALDTELRVRDAALTPEEAAHVRRRAAEQVFSAHPKAQLAAHDFLQRQGGGIGKLVGRYVDRALAKRQQQGEA